MAATQARKSRHRLTKASTGEFARLVESCPTFAGREKHWDMIITRVGGFGGAARRLMVASRDITEIKNTEYNLRASEAKLRLGLDIAGVGVGAIDYIANSTTLDAKAAELFDLPAGIPIPRSQLDHRFHPDDRPMINEPMATALDPTGSGFMSIEHRVVAENGQVRWMSARKHIFFKTDTTGAPTAAVNGLLAVRDISERKGAQARINDLMSEVNNR